MSRFAPGAGTGSTFTLALVTIATGAVTSVVRALRNRHAVTRLTDLDDRALKDIGLLRTDVYAALAGPLHHDPSVHLIDVAGYKRAAPKDVASGRSVETLRKPERQGFGRRAPEAVASTGTNPVAC